MRPARFGWAEGVRAHYKARQGPSLVGRFSCRRWDRFGLNRQPPQQQWKEKEKPLEINGGPFGAINTPLESVNVSL